MSRLIVKNLPSTITSDKLKERFSSQGIVTDVQLKFTQDGKFRHFGFIGFQSPEEAERAASYFNETFINQCKITVEHCAELGDPNKPKAWSKYAPDSSAYKKLHVEEIKAKSDLQKENEHKVKKDKTVNKSSRSKQDKNIDPIVAEKFKQHKDDPMFLEFLEAHAKQSGSLSTEALRSLTGDNDSGVDEKGSDSEDGSCEADEGKKSAAFSNISDLEYLKLKKSSTKSSDECTEKVKKKPKEEVIDEEKPQFLEDEKQLFTVKLFNLAYGTKKKEIKDFFRPLKLTGLRIPPKNSGFAYVSFKTPKEMKKALNKNKSFLKGKQIGVKEYRKQDDTGEQGNVNVKNEKQNRWKEQEEALLQEESIAESGSIFVRNLTYTVTEEELTQHFSAFGPLAEVNMPVDRETRRMKGFATVTFVMPEQAVAAYSKLDGTVFHGRMLHLLPAKTKHSPEEDDEGKSFKDKKKDKLKASAGQSHNWNTLFLGQNAVAEIMAETYNISKQEVLTGSDVAVRMALGETQIVSDTRQFLLNNGVLLDAFNQAPKARSKTVILAKNLPAKSTASEIREMFCRFGELGRVILPPIGVTAIIEFLEPSEAKKAFLSLAYTKFKHLPLYLEWAPDDTFAPISVENESGECNASGTIRALSGGRQASGGPRLSGRGGYGKRGNKEKEENSKKDNENEDTQNVNKEETNEEGDEEDIEPEPETTLYVKNLNFDSTEESIKKHFSKCGKVASITIARKKDPARPGQLLSMGYGFVQFYKQSQLTQALKQLQNSLLDDHQLELKRSNRTLQNDQAAIKKKNNVEKQTGTKILVRNIPFQATEKELLQLFKTFGEIKALRLPKKMVGTGPHRGFAFVEFCTKHDAKRAMQALCQSTHFFGRRLVLEWAQQDENVDDLRKRTALNFQQESAPRSKKARADLEITNEDEED